MKAVISGSTQRLIELLKEDDVQDFTISAIVKLAKDAELCGEIGTHIPWLIKLIKDEDYARPVATTALAKLAEHCGSSPKALQGG